MFYSGNKGFHFKFFSQNFDDFRKSMKNTNRLSQKAKQFEDDFSRGGSRIKPKGDDSFGYLSRFA